MGTVVSFLVDPGELTTRLADLAIDAACHELHELDDRFSMWKPDSELSRWRAGLVDDPSRLLDEVMELCAEARDISGGYFDAWAMPGGFDPTGLVKGWAAQRALDHLARAGVQGALVNAGGDVCVLPGRVYSVGVRHPDDPDALCAVVPVEQSIATSGVYERGNHLLNPFGGEVAAVAATVTGPSLALSDALATALTVGATEVLYLIERLDGYEGFFIDAHGASFKTSGLHYSND